ncbi:hypothetical protein V8D89_005360 [Ganoderma adspersum]
MAPAINLNATTGAYLIGTFFEIWLFGFTSLQSWYALSQPPFNPGTPVMCLECLHAAFSCHAAYFWLVSNFANPPALNISSALIVAGNLVFIVHCFFCYRVWAVSGRTYIMPCIIFTLALASYALFVVSLKDKLFSNFGHDTEQISTAGLSFKVATDVTIACSLGYFLHNHKSGMRRTDHLANQLIFWAVNIGVLTSIFDVLVLAWSEATSNLIFLAIYTIVGNLYSNSLLATLNIREYARTQVLAEDGTTLPLETIQFSDGKLTTNMAGSTTVFQTTSVGTVPDLPKPTQFRKGSSASLGKAQDYVFGKDPSAESGQV